MFARLFKLADKQESSKPIAASKSINVDNIVQPDSVLHKFTSIADLLTKIAAKSVLVFVEDEKLAKADKFNVERLSIAKAIFACKTIAIPAFINQTMSNINKLIHIKQQYEDYKNNFEKLDEEIRQHLSPKKLERLISVGKDYIDECRSLDLMFDDLMNEIGRYILNITKEKNNFSKLSTLTNEQVGIVNANSKRYLEDNYDSIIRDMGTVPFYQLIARAHCAVVAVKIKSVQYRSICDDPASAVSECYTATRNYNCH